MVPVTTPHFSSAIPDPAVGTRDRPQERSNFGIPYDPVEFASIGSSTSGSPGPGSFVFRRCTDQRGSTSASLGRCRESSIWLPLCQSQIVPPVGTAQIVLLGHRSRSVTVPRTDPPTRCLPRRGSVGRTSRDVPALDPAGLVDHEPGVVGGHVSELRLFGVPRRSNGIGSQDDCSSWGMAVHPWTVETGGRYHFLIGSETSPYRLFRYISDGEDDDDPTQRRPVIRTPPGRCFR